MKKRILSLALCIVMVLGLFPTAAFAAEKSAGLANFVKTKTFTSGTFTDVLPKHWFYDNVETAYEYGLMVGNSATTFNPTGNVTIAETITVAARLHSIYHTGKDDFAASGPWYQTYVDYALEHSIIPAAYSSYTVAATRSQYAAILAAALPAEALQEINQVADGDIPDVRLSDVYGKAVYTLYRAGILTGSDDKGTFNPKSNIQRCEVAAIVSRMADVSLRKSVQNGDEGTISMADGQKMTNLVKEIGKLTDNGATQKDIKTYLEGVDWIKVVAETEDGGVSCRTEFGVTGVWTPEQPGRISSSAHTTTRATAQSLIDEIIDKLENHTYEIDSIVILCPYASEDPDFILDGYIYLANAISEYSGCTVTVIRDQAVNLELLKTLDRFDMVWFYSHGTLSNITNSAWAILDSDPYTMTGEFADSAGDYVLWSEDFFYGRTVINLNTGRIGVGGPFYEHYYRENQMEDMFFHFGSCNSMRTTKLASGLLSRGAAWVQGWTDSVWFGNDYAHLLGVVDCLLRGMEVQEAIDQATEYAQQKYSHYFQKDCQLVGLGNYYYHLDPSELLRHPFSFKFVDAVTGGALETSSVEQTCIDFVGDFTADLSDYHFMYIIKNGTGVSGYTQELHLGSYRMTFSAPGYENATVDFTVNRDLKEVVVTMTPAGSTNSDPIPVIPPETQNGTNFYVSFVDADTKAALWISELFDGKPWVALCHTENDVMLQSGFINMEITATDAGRLMFTNIPILTDGNYYLSFDASSPNYVIPDNYVIASMEITTDATGNRSAVVELTRRTLIVDDVVVTDVNVADILGNGTARFDKATNTLTLTNARISAERAVYANFDLEILIPDGTTSSLSTTSTQNPVIEVGGCLRLGNSNRSSTGRLSITGNGDQTSFAVLAEDIYLSALSITAGQAWGGFRANGSSANNYTGFLSVENVVLTEQSPYSVKAYLLNGGDISITNSQLTDCTDNGSILYAANNISLYSSTLNLTGNYPYMVWARGGMLRLNKGTVLRLTTGYTDDTVDHFLLCGAAGIQIDSSIRMVDPATGEAVAYEVYLYNDDWNSFCSIRYPDGTYPTQILLQ